MNRIVACAAATQENARCRKNASTNILCADHQRAKECGHLVPNAPVPNVVLFKSNANKTWASRFEDLGVQEKERNIQTEDARHAEHAQEFGRKADTYRAVPDSGVPVLGKEGGINMNILWALKELRETHNLEVVRLAPARNNPNMKVLEAVFTLKDEGVTVDDQPSALWELLAEFYGATFEHIHVWANPPKEDGKIVHTINASHRQPEVKPEAELHFGNLPGNWYVTSCN